MYEFFSYLEASAFSVWVRESAYGFQISLVLHALGMAFLVGIHFMIDLRTLGVAVAVPRAPLKNYLPLMWSSFVIALISGLMLLMAYPAKGLTNPVFFTKMLLIVIALLIGSMLSRQVLNDTVIQNRHKWLALGSLLLWITVITLGRLLAYTYKVLLSIELGF